MSQDDSKRLVEACRAGDSLAMQQLFDQYMKRLIGLVRQRFPERLNSRTSPDSTASSAVGDCLIGIREGRYVFEKSGDLWRLLTSIALNKLRERIRLHSAVKRDVAREAGGAPTDGAVLGVHFEMISRDPTPDEAAELADQLQALMEQEELSPNRQQVIKLTLQGYGIDEIATETKTSRAFVKSTVRDLEVSLREQLSVLSTIG